MWFGPPADSRRRLWLLIAAATLALRLPLLVQPYFYAQDEATYSALAVRLLAGGAPYVNAVDHKPPGAELTYAAAYAIAGRNHAGAVHALLLVVVALTALVVGEIGAALTGPSGRVAGLLYAIASTFGPPGDMQAANTELLLNLPAAAAAWFAIGPAARDARGHRSLAPFAAAGALTGIAALFKYQAALAGLAWAFAILWQRPRVRPAIVFSRLAALAAGFAIVAVLYCGWFWTRGTWDAFWFWGWRFNFQYIGDLDAASKARNAAYYTLLIALLWSPVVVLAIARLRERGADASVLAWLVASAASVSVGGRFFPHYYLMALPPLAVMAAGARPSSAAVRRAVGTLGVAAAGASMFMAWDWLDLKPDLRRHHETYAAVGSYVRAHSRPGDTLFVWGNSSPIYYYADRVMGTRFPFTNYQTGMIWGTPADTAADVDTSALEVPRAWSELVDDLDRDPPAFIVDASTGRLDRFDRRPMTRYPLLAERLRRYDRAATIEGVAIYRRRDVTVEGARTAG